METRQFMAVLANSIFKLHIGPTTLLGTHLRRVTQGAIAWYGAPSSLVIHICISQLESLLGVETNDGPT